MHPVDNVNPVALEDMDIETLRQHLRSLIMELTAEECDRLWEMWNAQHS